MRVDLKIIGDTVVVRMQGELDHHAAEKLRPKIDNMLSCGRVRNILFNFQDVDFMDSSGLGMILGRYRAAANKGGRVLACSLRPPVSRVFELSGLQTRIPVCKSEQEALANLKGGEAWTIT